MGRRMLLVPVCVCAIRVRAVLVAPCQGCSTLIAGRGDLDPSPLQLGASAKDDVYERYGVPADLFVVGNQTVLLYNQTVARAGSLMLMRKFAPVLGHGHRHEATNSMVVVLDKDGVVQSAENYDSSDVARFRFWPFGE